MADKTTVYHGLLARVPNLPAQLLHGATAVAVSSNDASLARRVAARPELPDALVEKLLSLASVRLKPIRDRIEQIKSIGDTVSATSALSATALAKAVSVRGPDGRIVEAAVAAFMAKPTKTLFQALVNKPATWYTPQECEKLLRFASTEPRLSSAIGTFTFRLFAARLTPEAASELLCTVTHPTLVDALLHTRVSVAAAGAALVRSGKRIHQGAATSEVLDWAALLWSACFREDLSERAELLKLVEPVTKKFTRLQETADQLATFPYTPTGDRRQPWDTSPVNRPQPSTNLADATVATLKAHLAQPDTARITAALDVILSRGAQSELIKIGPVLLTNQHTSRHDVHRYLEALAEDPDGNLHWHLGDEGLENIDVVDLFHDDPDIVALWCDVAPHLVMSRHGWAPFNTPVRELWQKWAQKADTTTTMIGVLCQRALTSEELRETPMPVIRRMVNHPSGTATAVKVSRLLTEHLTTPDAVEVFGRLEEAFDGTLGELLDVATTLHE